MANTIYFVRHAATEWSSAGRLQGRADIPLSEDGKRSARELGYKIKDRIGDAQSAAWFSSPLSRARQTASMVAEIAAPDVSLAIMPELSELSWGDWEGRTFPEIERDFPILASRRAASKWAFTPPNGESYASASHRAKLALTELGAHKVSFAFSHEAIGRLLRGYYLGLEKVSILELSQPPGSVIRLSSRGETLLV